MCMDLFFREVPESKKHRVHFHKFMLDVHQRIHQYKQFLLNTYGRESHISLSSPSERDAIIQVARQIANESRILCFDEFQVTDICNAMILSKLFREIWLNGTILVVTSNR